MHVYRSIGTPSRRVARPDREEQLRRAEGRDVVPGNDAQDERSDEVPADRQR